MEHDRETVCVAILQSMLAWRKTRLLTAKPEQKTSFVEGEIMAIEFALQKLGSDV
jgi:hypothetical protein